MALNQKLKLAKMDLNFKNKVVLVAAGTKGLGFGTAKALAEEGASVFIGSRSEKNLAEALEKLGSNASGAILDTSSGESIKNWVDIAFERYGRIDSLLVNSGGPPSGSFLDFKEEDWSAAFNLTLMSAVRLIHATLPFILVNGSGSILTVTSSSVKEPIENLLLSNVFRAGVLSLVKSLSTEFGPSGIRINNIVPGRIDTDRVRELDAINAERTNTSSSEITLQHARSIPLGRYGTIEEFGSVAAFLLSDKSSYISGSSVYVDGGKIRSIL